MSIVDVLEGRARWCVVQGDCLDVLPTLPDRCVDHVITDPPYEAEAHTKQRRVKRNSSIIEVDENGKRIGDKNQPLSSEPLSFEPLSFELRSSVGMHISRLVERWAIVFCQVEAVIPWRSALSKLTYKRTAVWVKPDAMPQYSGDRPGMGYESIVCCHKPGRSRWNGGGRVGVFEHNKNSGGKHDHETQKPLPLMLELVELFTDPDELIIDPFCGSGTTGVACLRLGRRFIGIERDTKYAQLSIDRLTAEESSSTLLAHRAGQVPLFGAR